jgi:hypothetical protein
MALGLTAWSRKGAGLAGHSFKLNGAIPCGWRPPQPAVGRMPVDCGADQDAMSVD